MRPNAYAYGRAVFRSKRVLFIIHFVRLARIQIMSRLLSCLLDFLWARATLVDLLTPSHTTLSKFGAFLHTHTYARLHAVREHMHMQWMYFALRGFGLSFSLAAPVDLLTLDTLKFGDVEKVTGPRLHHPKAHWEEC